MRAYLVEILVIDHDNIGPDGIAEVVENTRYPNRCIDPHVQKVTGFDIGEWDDDHPLNQVGTDVVAYLTSTLMTGRD